MSDADQGGEQHTWSGAAGPRRTIRCVDPCAPQRRAAGGSATPPTEETGPRDVLLRRAVDWYAQHGVGDTSLRTLAASIGSSHRMLHYHFGSREGLLTAVVGEVWRRHRGAFDALLDASTDPAAAAWGFWTRLADQVALSALHVELSAAAMQGHAWAAGPARRQLAEWTQVLAEFFERLGNPPEQAQLLAQTSIAMTRGTLELLALTGDRDAADAVMSGFLTALERGPSAPGPVD